MLDGIFPHSTESTAIALSLTSGPIAHLRKAAVSGSLFGEPADVYSVHVSCGEKLSARLEVAGQRCNPSASTTFFIEVLPKNPAAITLYQLFVDRVD